MKYDFTTIMDRRGKDAHCIRCRDRSERRNARGRKYKDQRGLFCDPHVGGRYEFSLQSPLYRKP